MREQFNSYVGVSCFCRHQDKFTTTLFQNIINYITACLNIPFALILLTLNILPKTQSIQIYDSQCLHLIWISRVQKLVYRNQNCALLVTKVTEIN